MRYYLLRRLSQPTWSTLHLGLRGSPSHSLLAKVSCSLLLHFASPNLRDIITACLHLFHYFCIRGLSVSSRFLSTDHHPRRVLAESCHRLVSPIPGSLFPRQEHRSSWGSVHSRASSSLFKSFTLLRSSETDTTTRCVRGVSIYSGWTSVPADTQR